MDKKDNFNKKINLSLIIFFGISPDEILIFISI